MDGCHDNRVGRAPYFHPVDGTDCSATPAFEQADCFETEGEDCIQNLHRQVLVDLIGVFAAMSESAAQASMSVSSRLRPTMQPAAPNASNALYTPIRDGPR